MSGDNYNEGAWSSDNHVIGGDSLLRSAEYDYKSEFTQGINELYLGYVEFPEPEDYYGVTSVSIKMAAGDTARISRVAWPGPAVSANSAGTAGGVPLGIHGLHTAPAQGQMVAIGFANGSGNQPMVVEKYPYIAWDRPDLESLHVLPMSTNLHRWEDNVLGHFSGAYIALRGALPMPGLIERHSPTQIWDWPLAGYDLTTPAFCNLSIGGAYTANVGGLVSIAAGGTCSISATGAITISTIGAVTVTSRAATIVAGLTVALMGVGVPEPIVKGLQLSAQLIALMTIMSTHTHAGPGTPPGNAAAMTNWGAAVGGIVNSVSVTAT